MVVSKTAAKTKTASKNRLSLQFSYCDSTLPIRLADDIKRSSFSSRNRYLNALLEKLLSLPTRNPSASHLDELFSWMTLFESLPTERILQLAPSHNRNFDQMVKHLIETALIYYPENPQLFMPPREAQSGADAPPPDVADPRRYPTNSKPPAINDCSS